TLEGATDLVDLLRAAVRAALEDETRAAVLKVMIDEKHERLERLERRALRRRQIVRDAMTDGCIEKLVEPDFTAIVQRNAPGLRVVDEKLIPANYWENRPHLKKRELLADLRAG